MILVLGLILAGGVVGWVVGHYVGSPSATKTVTVSASGTRDRKSVV